MATMPEPPERIEVLTREFVAEFFARLEELGSLKLADLQPGLSDDEMDTITSPIGIVLPSEARIWWGFQNGFFPSEDYPHGRAALFDFPLVPLTEAVAEHQYWRFAIAADPAEDESHNHGQFAPTWFPFRLQQTELTIETDVPPGAPSAVRVSDAWAGDMAGHIAARSIAEALRTWLSFIDLGIYVFDAEKPGGAWVPGPAWDDQELYKSLGYRSELM